MENVKLEFSLTPDNFNLLENDGYCSIAEIDFLHLGINRNKCNITKEAVEKSLNSFYNKPLLAILNNDYFKDLSTDFKEHARDPKDKSKFIAFGTIPESSNFSFVTRDNGKTYLTAKVVIWKNYFPIIMKILQNKNGNTKVSIEIAVINGEQDEATGILNINEFRLLSCVMLGDDIMEGIEGSHLDVLRFSCDEEIQKANKVYMEFSNKNDNYRIPNVITNSIKEAIINYKTNIKKGCSIEDLKLANDLTNVNFINKIYALNLKERLDKSHSKLTFNLLGGKDVYDWLSKIVEESAGEIILNGLSNNELQSKIWAELGKYKYRDGNWEGQKYYTEEIYVDEKIIIIRDNETADLYKVPFTVDGDKVTVNLDDKKLVHKSYDETKDFSVEAVIFSKENYGSEDTLKVDKSKEAMSDSAWGSVNKSELRKKVLDAKNYKSIVKDVYMLVEDGWEESPSSKLKYPVMEIKNGKLVYNRYGLSSALAYAQKENEESVISKVQGLYKKLDIDNNEKGGEKKMVKEEIKNACEEEKVVVNKVDKDNKDIEKIKDDADAQEDDVKEEKKNSCEEVSNKIETDDKGKEGLEDDVDSDKDYWKKQVNALEVENSTIKAKLAKYKRAEEERKMSEEIDSFAHCMSKEELGTMKESVKTCACMDEVKNALNKKIAEYALKMKSTDKKEDKEMNYSYNPYYDFDSNKLSKKSEKDLKDIINNAGVKLAE